MTTMNYIGLDVHKKTISYCVKDMSGRIQQEARLDPLDASWIAG
jgi:transposase